MRRRAMITAVGAAVVAGGAGCMGGGEVVAEVQRSVRVDPGQYWSHELPDLGDSGGSIEFVARADSAFDVYVFTSGEDYTAYREALRGEDPGATPTGHPELSQSAVPADDGDRYEAATQDGGARESLSVEGPYYFIVDHTDYDVGPRPGDPGSPLEATVDLTLVENRV